MDEIGSSKCCNATKQYWRRFKLCYKHGNEIWLCCNICCCWHGHCHCKKKL